MKLAEFLLQGRQLRQQDRTSAIAYFEQCLQNIATDANSVEYMDTKARVLLDLALELIATQQTDQIQRAKVLVQQSRDILNQSLETSREQTAYLLYVRAILAMELGDLRDVLPTLQAAYEAYGNNKEGQALTDDAIGHYYIKISDYSSAIASFERSLSIRIESNDESAIGKSYAHLGQFYLLSGELNQANSLFQISLDLAIHQSDNFLRLQALKGLVKVIIADFQWQNAITLIKDTITLLKEPVDSVEIGYLYCDLAEALLGNRQTEESLICIRINVLPRFRDLQYSRGLAVAKHLRGRIYVHRLLEGLDSLNEDEIETAEDSLLEASMAFEQFGMMYDYAKTLYNLACLYQLCSSSYLKYQYQSKSLRSLELSLSVLEQLGLGNSQFASQVEELLNQAMRGNF